MSAGGHVTVMLEEAVEALAPRPDGIYIDATFGRGGHTRALLARLAAGGRVLALDRDPAAVQAGQALAEPRLTLVHAAFGELAAVAAAHGVVHADGVLFDLGVSSPQLDDPARGMSFRHDAPLDMRMDTSRGETAAQWLMRAELNEIEEVMREYGEERFAHAVAKALVAARAANPVTTTGQFAAIVAGAVRTREPGQHPATRCFQAVRIFVNQELEELSLALPQALKLLAAHARLVVISFHSLEDRIVKRFMRDAARPPQLPRRLPLRAAELPQPPLALVGGPRRPSEAEVAANPRARSAILRVAERSAAPLDAHYCA